MKPVNSEYGKNKIRAALLHKGITASQIAMLENSTMDLRTLKDGKNIGCLRLTGWSCYKLKAEDEHPDIKALRKAQMIQSGRDGEWYWLMRDGRQFYYEINDLPQEAKQQADQIDNTSNALDVYQPRPTDKKVNHYAWHIRGLKRAEAIKKLNSLSLSDWDLNTLMSMRNDQSANHYAVTASKPCKHWPKDPTASDKRLMDLGLMKQRPDEYYLTPMGVELFNSLKVCGYDKPVKASVPAVTEKPLPPVKTIDERMDIDLGRDGLLATASKLWFVWRHGDEVRQQALARQYKTFIEGQKAIEEAATQIATSEQRISRHLLDNPPITTPSGFWTVDMQRAQNDQYWATEGAAFWLNPDVYRGGGFNLNAEQAPAPEWWQMPDYTPRIKFEDPNKLLDEALLAPPVLDVDVWPEPEIKESPQGLSGPPGQSIDQLRERVFNVIVKEIAIAAGVGLEDVQLNTTLWLDLDVDDDFIAEIIDNVQSSFGLTSVDNDPFYNGDVEEMVNSVVEQLEVVQRHLQRQVASNAVDEILAELEKLNGDEHYDYKDWKEEYETRVVTQKGVKKPSVRVPKQNGEGFFMAQFNDEVRGFPNEQEAARWLRLAEKAQRIKDEHEKNTHEARDQANRLKIDALIAAQSERLKARQEQRIRNHQMSMSIKTNK